MSTSPQVLFAASVIAAALLPAPAGAQTEAASHAARSAPAPVATLGASPAALLDARRLFEQGRFKDARRAFRTLAAEQRAAGEYPVDALRGLSRAEFALNDDRATATTLDELAAAASQFGDPETRLRSLFDAALLWQGLGYGDYVASRLGDIQLLLKSPAIGEETRKDIAARIPKA
ncbi:MAG TPA: hypothetical protein VHE78_07495 [Gemmatimonadaceae bacterium]|nr:hypothetical protein [Gemmatimonadaceae bacterium]